MVIITGSLPTNSISKKAVFAINHPQPFKSNEALRVARFCSKPAESIIFFAIPLVYTHFFHCNKVFFYHASFPINYFRTFVV